MWILKGYALISVHWLHGAKPVSDLNILGTSSTSSFELLCHHELLDTLGTPQRQTSEASLAFVP